MGGQIATKGAYGMGILVCSHGMDGGHRGHGDKSCACIRGSGGLWLLGLRRLRWPYARVQRVGMAHVQASYLHTFFMYHTCDQESRHGQSIYGHPKTLVSLKSNMFWVFQLYMCKHPHYGSLFRLDTYI